MSVWRLRVPPVTGDASTQDRGGSSAARTGAQPAPGRMRRPPVDRASCRCAYTEGYGPTSPVSSPRAGSWLCSCCPLARARARPDGPLRVAVRGDRRRLDRRPHPDARVLPEQGRAHAGRAGDAARARARCATACAAASAGASSSSRCPRPRTSSRTMPASGWAARSRSPGVFGSGTDPDNAADDLHDRRLGLPRATRREGREGSGRRRDARGPADQAGQARRQDGARARPVPRPEPVRRPARLEPQESLGLGDQGRPLRRLGDRAQAAGLRLGLRRRAQARHRQVAAGDGPRLDLARRRHASRRRRSCSRRSPRRTTQAQVPQARTAADTTKAEEAAGRRVLAAARRRARGAAGHRVPGAVQQGHGRAELHAGVSSCATPAGRSPAIAISTRSSGPTTRAAHAERRPWRPAAARPRGRDPAAARDRRPRRHAARAAARREGGCCHGHAALPDRAQGAARAAYRRR